MLPLPVGIAAIFFAYKASDEYVGRGERTIWLACSCGLRLRVFLILLVVLTAL